MKSSFPNVIWEACGHLSPNMVAAADAVAAHIGWDDVDADGEVRVSPAIIALAVERLGGDWDAKAVAANLDGVSFSVASK